MDTAKTSALQIGDFVRQRRMASTLTQRELGELAGVGTRFISELERGKATLRMDAVNKVLNVFGRILSHVEAPRAMDRNKRASKGAKHSQTMPSHIKDLTSGGTP